MSSPTLSPQPDGGSFTYPPTYASLESNGNSKPILPTHHDALHTPHSPGRNYPPLAHTWNRIRTWLAREYPELGDTLNYGILPEDLAELELQFGFSLPAPIRESYLCVDGQEPESSAGCSDGLFYGLSLLPLDDVLEEWRFWRAVDDDPSTGSNVRLRELMQSIPPGWVRREYSQRGWIPLVADKTGNYIGVDLNPDDQGQMGQVIVFGRDFDAKVVLFRGEGPYGWANWLASFAEDLETGDGFEIGASTEPSSDSEDDVGYESYFYDGMGREGGDAGTGGGLRLTGEYRGWNVMEALADRSVRKWYEAGVIAERPPPEDEVKTKNTINDNTNVLDFAAQISSGAEVAIPVLADVDADAEQSSNLAATSNEIPPSPTSATALTQAVSPTTATAAPRQPARLPTISVTKPPAPLPVELPTPRDISVLPSPPDSRGNSFDEDLERGMREANPRILSRPQRSAQHKAHPLEQDSDETALPPQKEEQEPAKKEEIPDLLTGLDKDQPLVDTAEEISLDAPVAVPPSSSVLQEQEEEPQSTVRLVGMTNSKKDSAEQETGNDATTTSAEDTAETKKEEASLTPAS